MRPQEARRIVSHALKPFYSSSYKKLDTLLTKKVSKALDVLIEKDRLWYIKHWYMDIYDTRSVEDVYQSRQLISADVFAELHHISDRFNAAHRLKFLRYVIDNVNLIT